MSRFAALTVEEIEQVRELTRAGVSQREIAERLGRHRNIVYAAQQELGLARPWRGARKPVLTPSQRKEVLALSYRGIGVARIAKELGLREHAVRKVTEAHRTGLKKKHWHHLPPRELARLKRDISFRRDHALALAEKYDLEYKYVLRLVHQILGPGRIVAGRTRFPLTSTWPQRWPSAFSK